MTTSARLFRDLTEEFLAWRSIYGDSRQTSRYNVQILLRHFAATPITEIRQPAIESFIAARLKEGVQRSTINRQRATLSKFFNWAISRSMHPGPNPVRAVQKFRESPGRIRYLSPDEAARLILAAAAHLKPIVVAALDTGGRLGELLALRRADADLDRRIVLFRRETTKSHKERVVPMTDRLAGYIRDLGPGRPDELLFVWRGLEIRTVRTAFSTARRKAGLGRDVLFHSLRHTFASWAVMNGIDLYRLQRYMGHSTSALTQRYAHLSPDFVQEGVRFLGPPGSSRRAKEEEP